MKYRTLCNMYSVELIKDNYTGEILTVEDAIDTVRDRWTDYDGELYPFHILNKHGTPDLTQGMTKQFADMFCTEFTKVRI